jgi:hypothetical protein
MSVVLTGLPDLGSVWTQYGASRNLPVGFAQSAQSFDAGIVAWDRRLQA